MALFWRIWAAVTLVNLAVLTLFVGIATIQYGTLSSGLVGERLVVLGNRIAKPFEAAARIGLPLSTVRNAVALLERGRQTDDAIIAIHVFDAAGRIVHSTSDPPPATIPVEALTARATSGGAPWYRDTPDGFLSGIEITSRTSAAGGGILIVYPAGSNVTRIWAMAAQLALAAIAVLLIGGGLSALLLRIGSGRQIRLFESIDGAVTHFERNNWRSAAGQPGATANGYSHELGSLLEDAERRYHVAGRALAEAEDGAT